jgi:hypothetical protein
MWTKGVRWMLVAVMALLMWPMASLGQGVGDIVYITIPTLDLNETLGGRYAQANFAFQGITPVRSGLSFPTAVVCVPDGSSRKTLYIAEFFFAGSDDPENPTPETRISEFTSDGQRGDVITVIKESFVVGMELSDDGQLFVGTGVYPGRTEFTGVWRANANSPGSAPTQIVKPSALQELLDLLETTSNPSPPEVRQLALIPDLPEDRQFAGELLFTAGAATEANYNLYRVGANGGTPSKVAIGDPWHSVSSEPSGTIFVGDFLNNKIVKLSDSLTSTTDFAEINDPFQLEAASSDRVYVITDDFDFDRVPNMGGLKTAALFQVEPFNRVIVAANGAWGVALCR